jgi:solute carrier family 25 (mitochondrial carnitine/acylcarnitine transporter), member 20/29
VCSAWGRSGVGTSHPSPPPPFSSPLPYPPRRSGIRKTIKWEGPLGLYKGVGAPLGGQLFFRSLLFGVYAKYLAFMQGRPTADGKPHPLTYLEYGIGGAISWGIGSLIECPLQVASSQLQTQVVRVKAAQAAGLPPPVTYAGVIDYIRRAPAAYGLRSMYSGLHVHLARNIPGGFSHFFVFESLRREYAKANGKAVTDIGLLANMTCGSIAGVFFWGTTFPIDVIKSAIQGDSLDPKLARYTGAADAARKLWAEGGFSRFTRGLSASMLRAVPANAALLSTAAMVREAGYEYLDRPIDE